MGDHVHEDMVRAALMADLGRLRQEELPLSDEAKRPSFTPNNYNGTDEYTRHRKYQLSTKWGSKIEDDEARQMQGLEIQDARPGPPPRMGPREGKKGGNAVVFNPPRQAWKACVDNMPKNSPLGTQSATREESATLKTKVKAEASNSEATATPTIPLIFTLHANEVYSNALELVVGSGHCLVVPSKHEALSFLCRVELLINDKKGGILTLHSQEKGSQVHNVLDVDKPVVDGKYCVVKAKSKEWPYNIRFDTLEYGKKFRSCLSRLKKAALYHQEPVKSESATDEPKASQSFSATQGDISIVSKPIFDAASLSTAADVNVLIPMDSKWQTPRNVRVSQLEPAVTRMVPLVQNILERFIADNTCTDTIAGLASGIEDAILDKWLDEGWMKEYDEEEREGCLALIRALVDMQLILSGGKRKESKDQPIKSRLDQEGHRAQEATTHQQANDSAKQSERKATKGLSASCFAKAPFSCANAFTGPQSRPPYK
ncbi:hypothetical protein NW752_000310 [Fusarium irregulare]|nr:hypothetical protein NW752_000310 [Fusarium irregulare]